MRIPDRVFTRPLLVRGLLIWGASRACLAVVVWLMSGLEDPLTFAVTAKAAIWIAVVAGVLGWLELRRRHEHLLLANLGVRERTLGLLAAAPGLLGEFVVAVVGAGDAARG